MKISIHRRTKILLLFLLGIGFPSLVLGYLAFRGIKNDQALLEKERVNEYRRIAELVTNSVEENIVEVEQAFFNTIASHPETIQHALILAQDSVKHQNQLVEEVFFLQNLEKIHFPIAKLLFLSNSSTQMLTSSSEVPTAMGKVQIAQRLEFQENNYQKALSIYREVHAKVSDTQTKGEVLGAIARVQTKSALFRDAIKTYETIAQNYSRALTTNGLPLGLAARLELGSLFLAINDSLSAMRMFMESYRNLIHRKWTMEKAQYDFFEQEIEKSIDSILSRPSLNAELQPYPNSFALLKEEGEEQRKSTERLLAFQDNTSADLKAKVSRDFEDHQSSTSRFAIDSGEHTYLLSLLKRIPKTRDQDNGIWGLLLNADYLKDNVVQQALQRHVSSKKTGWIVKDKDGKSILISKNPPSGSMIVKTSFAGNFPHWSIEFHQQQSPLFDTFFTSRRSVYFYMFLLIAGILIFGLTLTIRAVTHEFELAKMKSDFVSTISHEFKSPLTSIRQMAEMLKTKRVPSEERRHRYYDVLVKQSERLSLLIDNILDFSKMEEGKKEFEFENVDIKELLEETVSIIQDRVRYDGFVIEMKIEEPVPSIKVDRAAINQAINNLIDNAIKFSAEVKKVNVRAFTENRHLIIAVQDFGIGIRREEMDKVFERFYRGGDELTRTVKGSGLGLTLVKQIVEAHHGTVHVESEPGRGSTFSIRLPIE